MNHKLFIPVLAVLGVVAATIGILLDMPRLLNAGVMSSGLSTIILLIEEVRK